MRKAVLKIAAPYLIILVLFAVIGGHVARAARIQRGGTPIRQTPPRVKSAEEVEKNIKVMKGMPDAQVIPTMRFMSASLGVRCDFCHVSKDGQLDAASDAKKEKETARDMIKMVRAVNRANFRGEPQISCFTCHMGQPLPQKFPALPVAVAPPTESFVAGTAANASPLPSGATIVQKYINAIGGQNAIERIMSCVMRGKLATASGLTGTYETEQVPPDKGYESIMTPRGGRERAINQKVGWEKSSFGVIDLLGQQLSDMRLSLPLLLDIGLKREYSEIEVSTKEKIDNRDVYVVDATRKDQKRERLYFDAENGLLVRRITFAPTMIGIIPEQIDLSDYREIQGVKFPFAVRVSTADSNNPTTTRSFEQVEINVPVSSSQFQKPKAD
jgi:photosynthetic reaction center cytochrome c subunit